MRLALAVFVLSGCSDGPCDLIHLDDAPAAGAGEVRHGLALDEQTPVTAGASGVVCLPCDRIFYLDHALVKQRSVSVSLAGSAALALSGDITFVVDSDLGTASDGTSGYPHFRLFALSATGHELWHNDVYTDEGWGEAGPIVLAGPASVVVYGVRSSHASIFDSATGAAGGESPSIQLTSLSSTRLVGCWSRTPKKTM